MSARRPSRSRTASPTYLGEQLGAAVTLHDVQRIAVGWSHETWLFDATWTVDGVATPRRACACGATRATRCCARCRTSATQFTVLRALESTAVPAPKAYFFEDDPAVLGAPFLVMEKVPGVCPSPWGRDGQAFYRAAAERGVLPASFTDALVAIHTADWAAAGLDVLGVPEPGEGFVRRELAKWRALIDASGRRAGPGARRRARAGWTPTCRSPTAARSSTARTAPATC